MQSVCQRKGVQCENDACQRSGCTEGVPYCSMECRDVVMANTVYPPACNPPACSICENITEWSRAASGGDWQCAHFENCQSRKASEVDVPRGKYGPFRWMCQRCNVNICGKCGQHLCKMPGCQKATHDGSEGYCSQLCFVKHLPIKRQANRKGGDAQCNRPGCLKKTWNGLVGEWCSSECKTSADEVRRVVEQAQTMEQTKFAECYSKKHEFTSPDDVWAAIQTVLRCVLRKNGKDEGDAPEFVEELKKAVREANVKPEMALRRDSPTMIVIFCWTCSDQDRNEREWCSYLQEAVREDLGECMEEVAKIWRAMNKHVVNIDRERSKSGLSKVKWPADRKLHRGGRMMEQQMQWFRERCDAGQIFRCKNAISTSKIKNKAMQFMTNWSHPKDDVAYPQVHWIFKLVEDEYCVHVNCLEDHTLVEDEQEFLFPPYSAFKVLKIEWKGDHYAIEVEVMTDNRTTSFGGEIPDHSPLSPWS